MRQGALLSSVALVGIRDPASWGARADRMSTGVS